MKELKQRCQPDNTKIATSSRNEEKELTMRQKQQNSNEPLTINKEKIKLKKEQAEQDLIEDGSFSSSSSQLSCDENQQKGLNNSKSLKKKKNPKLSTFYRKYSRITPEIRQKLISMVARSNMSIKQAAQKLKINYSSAKFIFSQHRQKKLFIAEKGTQRNEHSQSQTVKLIKLSIDANNKDDGIVVKCSSGGKFQAQTSQIFTLKQLTSLYSKIPTSSQSLLKLQQ